jgi:soluble lytic murein transglycosylase-like protein
MIFRSAIVAAGLLISIGGAARAEGEASESLTQRPSARRAAAAAPEASIPFFAPPRPDWRESRRRRAEDFSGAAGVRAVIARQAALHGVPVALADAVARLESRYNPRAANRGNFGLMQIRLQTARGEGYGGSAQGLLDLETNAHFGIKHLARAYRMANGDACGTIMRYQSGLRATRMSGANLAYCAKARAIMGTTVSSADARTIARR